MIGIEVKEGYTNKEIAGKLIENGLLVLTAGPGMRLLPPLVISKEEMDQGVAIMKKSWAEKNAFFLRRRGGPAPPPAARIFATVLT